MGRLCLDDRLDCLLGAEFNVSCVTSPPLGAQAGKMPTWQDAEVLLKRMLLAATAIVALLLILVDSCARIREGANP